MVVNVSTLKAEDAADALDTVNRYLAPCGYDFALGELMSLYYATKSRKESAEDEKARVMVYAKDLSRYPADILQEVVSDLRNTEKFFPALSDIDRAVNANQRYGNRMSLRRQLTPKAFEATGWKIPNKRADYL